MSAELKLLARSWKIRAEKAEAFTARLLTYIEAMGERYDECTWDAHKGRLCKTCNCHRKQSSPVANLKRREATGQG
jgi:hypothetical protein